MHKKADAGDKASLVKAFTGAEAVYAVTNFWEKMDMQIEITQGKNMADAALVRLILQHFIVIEIDSPCRNAKSSTTSGVHYSMSPKVHRLRLRLILVC